MVDLHWSEAAFWASTPYAFHAACEVAFERTKEGRERARVRKYRAWRDGLEKQLKDRDG